MLFVSVVLCTILAAPPYMPLVNAAPFRDSVAPLLPSNGSSLTSRQKAQCTSLAYNTPPCVCNKELGLRLNDIECPGTTFAYQTPNDPTDGTLKLIDTNLGIPYKIQCDHIVELQFIAREIGDDLCGIFTADPDKYKQFFDYINSGENLVDMPSECNSAKGALLRGSTLQRTTSKAANAVASFVEQLLNNGQQHPGIGIAQSISDKLDEIVGKGNGFAPGFATRFQDLMKRVKNEAKAQAPRLDPYQVQGSTQLQWVYTCSSDFSTRSGIQTSWLRLRGVFKTLLGRSNSKASTSPSGADCVDHQVSSQMPNGGSRSSSEPPRASLKSSAPAKAVTKSSAIAKTTKAVPTSTKIQVKPTVTAKTTKVVATTAKVTVKPTVTAKTTKPSPGVHSK